MTCEIISLTVIKIGIDNWRYAFNDKFILGFDIDLFFMHQMRTKINNIIVEIGYAFFYIFQNIYLCL